MTLHLIQSNLLEIAFPSSPHAALLPQNRRCQLCLFVLVCVRIWPGVIVSAHDFVLNCIMVLYHFMVLARVVVLTHGSLEDEAQNSPVFQKSNKRSNLTSVLTCNLIFCITLGLIDPMSDQSVPEFAIAIFCVCICIFILICICFPHPPRLPS